MLLNFNLMRTKEISGQHIHRSHTHTHISRAVANIKQRVNSQKQHFFFYFRHIFLLCGRHWRKFTVFVWFVVCCLWIVCRVYVRHRHSLLFVERHTACHTPPISTFVYGRLNLIAYNRADEQTNVKEEIRTPRRSVHRANVSSGMWLYNVSDARSL